MPYVNEQTTVNTFITDDFFSWSVSLDIIPTTPTANYQEILVRLTADAEEIAITRYSYNHSEFSAGVNCEFTLADIADRTTVLEADAFTFEKGRKQAGVITWKTIGENMRLSNSSFSVAGDTFSFSAVDGLAAKLNKTPSTDLMIYDPAESPFDADELEVLTDTSGNEYEVEDFPIEDLTLHLLLEEILVNRCGFSDFATDIPDFPIIQASFEMGVPLFAGLKGFLGAFYPVIEEIAGVIHIKDTTIGLPEGHPEPTDLTNFGVQDVSINGEYSTADAVLLTVTDDEWDFIENQPKVFNETETDDNFTYQTNVIQNFHLYKHHLRPDTIVKKELQAELRDTYRSPGLDHYKETIFTNTFDRYGRIERITRVNNELVPDLENEGDEVWTENVSTEVVNIDYAQHPYFLGGQFEQKISRISSGLAVEDESNTYLGSSFIQSYRDAHRSGNLQSGQAYLPDKILKTHVERFQPDRNGQVKREFSQFDNIRGVEIDYIHEPRTGETALNGNFRKPHTIIVLETDASVKGEGTFLPLSVADVPLNDAIPLARRTLVKVRDYNKTATLNIIGVDLSIRRGAIYSVKDKQSALEGVFIIEGYSGEGQVNEDGSQTHTMQVRASQVPYVPMAEVTSYSLRVNSGQSITIERDINCLDGYELSSETVSDLTVEARISGSWTNIETTPIDLSPYDGTTQTFEVRLTASSVTAITHKLFKLIVQRP